MHAFLQRLIPDMLQKLRDVHECAPAYLWGECVSEDDTSYNDTCHAEWDEELERMIFLWRESDEVLCSKENLYDEDYEKASVDFEERYGILGEKLQTKEEWEKIKKHGGWCRIHFMHELPEYKEIADHYFEEEAHLWHYRNECKDMALDMMKMYFWDFWD